MARRYRRWVELVFIIALVLVIDQTSKRIVLDRFDFGDSVQPIPALAPLFQITVTENRGAAFGFLPQAGDLFLVIALVVTTAMFIFYPRIPYEQWVTRIGVALVCGGALGNALDRLQHGIVIDFIHYQIPGVISNVSNLADHAIVFGVIVLLVVNFRSGEKPQQNEKLLTTENTPEPFQDENIES
jgi:signal peptidase II